LEHPKDLKVKEDDHVAKEKIDSTGSFSVISKVCDNKNFEFSHLENNSYRFHFDLGKYNIHNRDHFFTGKVKLNENLTKESCWIGANSTWS